MSETLGKIVALMLAVFLFYVFPVENLLSRQDDITRVYVFTETTKFVDSVRDLGYVTPLMYLQYTHALSATGNQYDILMEHRHGCIDPVYTDPDDMTSFQQDYRFNESAVYTEEIMKALFPEPNANSDDWYYYFSKGDYFSVRVSNKNQTAAAKVQNLLYMIPLPEKRISVNYGGMVRDEAD